MAITDNRTAFVDASPASIALSQMFTVTPGSSDPAYLVLTVLDRNEYTATSTGATGTLAGNGHTLGLGNIGGDGRGTGIVFTYQASTGRYYNSTYGYLDQLVYTASGSPNDITNLSLFGTSSLNLANAYATDAVAMMEFDAAGYLGSATVATQPGYAAGVPPTQATPDSIVAAADSFVGQAWNMDGCWTLASSIAAEAGAGLPVQSTLTGLPGAANGEWIVAFDGPAGQSGSWQSLVKAGEMIVFQPAGGGGHITTCVSGSGSTAMLVDNITYVNGSGQVVNLAGDGSSSDVTVAAPHLASQEFAGVSAGSVVIYELDTPTVIALAASETLACLASLSLESLFSASDPASKAITSWQVYDSAATDSLVLGGTQYSDHSAADALTTGSLSAVSLLAGSVGATDTLEVRAYNGSYWGDWTSLAIGISATAPSSPVLQSQTPNQSWTSGQAISLALAAGTFQDPQNEALTYTATLANGQALPGWLMFDPATDSFAGTAPATAQTLSIDVTATDTSGLSASDIFTATIVAPPKLTDQTANQAWTEGSVDTLALPANTFTDPQNQPLTYAATLSSGAALPSWLQFNGATDSFSGTAPATAQSIAVAVTATDASQLTATDIFTIAVVPPPPTVAVATPNQTWTDGQAIALSLPADTFAGPAGETLTYVATLANGQALPGWLIFDPATASFSGTPMAAAQTLSIAVTATDSSGQSASETFSATVIAPPAVTGRIANQVWVEGSTDTLALPANTFTDPQNQPLTLSATLSNGAALPSWLQFDSATGIFTATAPATAQSISVAVTATDTSQLTATDVFSIAVAPAGPVVAVPTPNQTLTEGQFFTLGLPSDTFTAPAGETLRYTATLANGRPLPFWLHFDAATDSFSGRPPDSAQTLAISVKATDSSGQSVTDSFAATVLATPTISAYTRAQTWTEGSQIALTLPANMFTDPQQEALTYTATLWNGQALPGWLQFDAATETFSGTAPGTAQRLAIKVTATDTSGLSASDYFGVTIQPGATVHPGIAVTNQTPNQAWADGSVVDFTLPANTFTDALGLRMNFAAYEISGPNVTSWLRFNPATDTLLGQVPNWAAGTVELAVVASDAQHMTAMDLFDVTFSPNLLLNHTSAIVAPAGSLSQVETGSLQAMMALPS